MISMARIFGAPVIDPPGKVARNTSASVTPGRSSPATCRHQVMQRRKAVHLGERVDADAAGAADAPEVVALQVDDHDVLGALLGIRCQPAGERRVGLRVGAAPRACL